MQGKRKWLTKVSTGVMSLALVFALAACGGANDGTGTTNDTTLPDNGTTAPPTDGGTTTPTDPGMGAPADGGMTPAP
ncbi:hypothetical protein IDH44_14525 [Paenibacillus sp. IB182496]|uniref:Uncharacterized protein n=1 Tax=Paenibacillus sabuli TaxID=2772509 RepID=A0A927BW27_9BACL|nr:hypothetical protein [Paenibacillus sabuli]MBD2846413.1 hypothetical protein [Paenibacillus sabuli]